ncbi:serine/threonine-protein kinase [Gordonia asplenii]|uniref:serine/threonine-protein kinase n=1 Tax=Gordonia asplenii TaxID=2725283 RepID=UPI001B7D6DA9|nr:serine/threonine-protein kinase [Gordonia asplenii]
MAERRLAPGDVLAGYEVIRPLGAGGMGTVYLARHPRLPRNQALKVLAATLGNDPAFRQRFRREADLAAQLDHPNIVAVQDAGVEHDVMWIAMQYVEGTDASALIRDEGPMSTDRALDIARQVAAGLDYAHEHGMLHRDVKPANILVAPGWERTGRQRVLIGDFGIARSLAESSGLTSTGTMIGTLAYAAPEMLTSERLTPAVDQYALGCTLYELLVGSVVFPRTTQLAIMHAHANDAVPRVSDGRPDLPRDLDDVIARALAKNPADRYPSSQDFVAAATVAAARSGGPADTAGQVRFTKGGPGPTVVPDRGGQTTSPGGADQTTVRRPHDPTAVPAVGDQSTVWHGQDRSTVEHGPAPSPYQQPPYQQPPNQQPPNEQRAVNPTLFGGPPSGPQYPPQQPPGWAGPPAGGQPVAPANKSRKRTPIIAGVVAAIVVAVVLAAVLLWPKRSGDDTAATTTPPVATTATTTETTDTSTTDTSTTGTSTAATPTTPTLADIVGTWSGEVKEGDTSYGDAVLTITAAKPLKATVNYKDRGCVATWTERDRTDTRINITEHSTSGSCTDATAELSVNPDGSLAMYTIFYSPKKGGDVYTGATLNRK